MKLITSILVLIINFNLIYCGCRSGYTYYKAGNGWFKLYQERKSYEDAKSYCKQEGAVLVPAEKREVILEMMIGDYVDYVFVSNSDGDSDPHGFDILNGRSRVEAGVKHAFICYAAGSVDDVRNNKCDAAENDTDGNFTKTINIDSSSTSRVFRSDYSFLPDVDGWLKLHQVPANWREARRRCRLEGATLVTPLNQELIKAMINVISESNLMGVYTGISATYSRGDFYSIEGIPIGKIPVSWAPNEPNSSEDKEQCIVFYENGTIADVDCRHTYPYICYKKYTNLQVSPKCGTTDPDYIYSDVTRHCYKFHRVGQIWSRAFMTCAAEGGYLAIINSEEEARVLQNIFVKFPSRSIMGEFKEVTLIGFKTEDKTNDWMTVQGQTLEEAGYENWSTGEPNNDGGQYCGGMYRSGRLDDLGCDKTGSFICEMIPGSLLDDNLTTLKSIDK